MLSFFFLLSFLLPVLFAQKCALLDTIKPKDIKFSDLPPGACSLSVVATRLRDCSLRVSETIEYPFTNGSVIYRFVDYLTDVQTVTDVEVRLDDQPIKADVEKWLGFGRYFAIPMNKSTASRNAFKFVLNYRVPNAVMKFDKSCHLPYQNASNNIYQWSLGEYHRSINKFSIKLLSEIESSRLRIVQKKPGSFYRTYSSQGESIEIGDEARFYIEERGAPQCGVPFECVLDEFPKWKIVIIFVMVGIPFSLLLGTVATLIIGTLFGYRDAKGDDDEVADGEMLFDDDEYQDDV